MVLVGLVNGRIPGNLIASFSLFDSHYSPPLPISTSYVLIFYFYNISNRNRNICIFRFEASDTSAEKADVIRIETLYHADKVKTEAYITDQLVWLHYLVTQSRMASISFSIKSVTKPPALFPQQKKQISEVKTYNESSNLLTAEKHHQTSNISAETQTQGISKIQELDAVNDDVKEQGFRVINQVKVIG